MTNSYEEAKELIKDLTDYLSKHKELHYKHCDLNTWEKNFVENINTEFLGKGKPLSAKQINTIVKIWNKIFDPEDLEDQDA